VLEYFKKLLERIEKEKIVSREIEISTIPNKAVVIAGPRRWKMQFSLSYLEKQTKDH
jgi:hypothetical protein